MPTLIKSFVPASAKQILYCLLILILYSPSLLPDSSSKWLEGGMRKSLMQVALSSMISFRRAIFCMLWGSFRENCWLYIFSVSLSEKFFIIILLYPWNRYMSKIFNHLSSTLYAMSELVEEEVCDACLFSCRAIWMSCHSSSVRFSGRELSADGAELFSLAGEAGWWQLSKLLISPFFDVSDSDTSFFVLFFPAKHWPQILYF